MSTNVFIQLPETILTKRTTLKKPLLQMLLHYLIFGLMMR